MAKGSSVMTVDSMRSSASMKKNQMTSDASDTPKKDVVESATEQGGAEPNPDDPQRNAEPVPEPVPIVEIRYSKDIEDDARAYKRREQRRDRRIGGRCFLKP
jgi:hypothetical protein